MRNWLSTTTSNISSKVPKPPGIAMKASDSSIISLAHEINEGVLPYSVIEKQHDRNFIPCNDELMIDFLIKVVQQGIDSGMDLVRDIQVLVPMYKGTVGIDSINYKLQDAFNMQDDEVVYNGKRFRERIRLTNKYRYLFE